MAPDISKCADHECPVRNGCYRFVVAPSEFRQSYFSSSPRLDERPSENTGPIEGSCSYYWALPPQPKTEEDGC